MCKINILLFLCYTGSVTRGPMHAGHCVLSMHENSDEQMAIMSSNQDQEMYIQSTISL